MNEYVEVKVTRIDHCQVCDVKFESGEGVYFAPVDNSIVCHKCSKAHKDRQLRVVEI